jgi:hypothetical protein
VLDGSSSAPGLGSARPPAAHGTSSREAEEVAEEAAEAVEAAAEEAEAAAEEAEAEE